MGRVRAYSLGGRFVVQFYDSGDCKQLSCPHCSWQGGVEVSSDASDLTQCHEQHCQRCGAVLAMISSEVDSYVETQSIFQ